MIQEDSTDRCQCCSSLDRWCDCVRGASPSLHDLRRIFTLLLQYLFSDSSRLAEYSEALECRTYDSDKNNTKISISPTTVVDPGDTENIPGILVQAGDDGMQFEPAGLTSDVNESTDYASHEEVWKTTVQMQFVCRDKDADVAGIMSDAVMLFLVALRPKLFRTLSWLREFDPVSVTEPKIAKNELDDTSTDRWYESVASVKITAEYRVYVAEESRRLKDFSLYAHGKEGYVTLDSQR